MKMTSSLSKILETGINVFKSNSQIIKNKKIKKYQLKRMRQKIIEIMAIHNTHYTCHANFTLTYETGLYF